MPSSPTKRNIEYWRKRFVEMQLLTERMGESYLKNINYQFETATKNIKKKLDQFYMQFADMENISYLEAKKLLNSDELEEFHMSVDEYVELLEEYDHDYNKKILKQLERASLKYRVTRLEAIELQLMCEVAKAYEGVPNSMLEHFKDVYIDRYYRSTFTIFKGYGIGVSLEKINTDSLETLLKKPWAADGKNFSDRVWENREKLVQNLSTELTQGLIMGQSYDVTTKKMQKKMNTDFYKCRRIVATESAYFASLSQERSWKDLGMEEYEIVATLDERTSEICQDQDGKVYKMKDFEIGKTAPPLHVNCRSTTSPHTDFSDIPGYIVGERAARGKDGKTYYVPANLNYKEWYKQYVEDK